MNSFNVGDHVIIQNGVQIPGIILSVFRTRDGELMAVVEPFVESNCKWAVCGIDRLLKVSHGLNFDMMGG